MRKRWTRVARPTSTSSRPVANGSSVPAWPTLTPAPSCRRTRATTSCDVTPAGLSTSRTPSALELLGKLAAQEVDELREPEVGREAGRAAVPAAAARPGDAGEREAGVGGAQRDLAGGRALGELIAHQARHRGALDGAQVVHDALGVALVGARRPVIVAREVRQREQAAVVALDVGEPAREQLELALRDPLVQAPVDPVRID